LVSGGEPNVFGRLSRLPTLRPAAARLLSISLDSDSAVSEFESAFRSDPALAADLLIVANSPLLGLRATVQTIRHAIAMLGLEGIRSLALTIALRGYMRTGRYQEQIRSIWRHSMATAVIAEALATVERKAAPLLFTASLIHDIGRLALLQIAPDKYSQILEETFAGTKEYLDREKLLFDCSHDDAGAFLALAWSFPTTLCDCIRFHHWDIATHAGPLFELVGVACRLADSVGFPEVQREDIKRTPQEISDLIPIRLRGSTRLSPERLQADVETHLLAFPESGLAGRQ
jgi:HD-like signal output (HDOD) protein